MKNRIATILSIAGSDSCGGAGIQADIKTATNLKTFATTAITCVTAQNTQRVSKIDFLSIAIIQKQIATVLDDIEIGAIKTGMLGNSQIVKIVAKTLKSKAKNIPIVIDPVMVATSGDSLISNQAISDLKKHLLPLAYLVTPNIPEAELLAEMKITSFADIRLAAEKIQKFGVKNVLIKGGHLKLKTNRIFNILTTNKQKIIITNKKITKENIHGTGCTLSSAIACFLAQNFSLEEAVKKANRYVYKSIKHGWKIGKGSLVLNHYQNS